MGTRDLAIRVMGVCVGAAIGAACHCIATQLTSHAGNPMLVISMSHTSYTHVHAYYRHVTGILHAT